MRRAAFFRPHRGGSPTVRDVETGASRSGGKGLSKRNNWTRDEVILTLNDYFSLGENPLKSDPEKFKELCNLLRRSEGSVRTRLGNFAFHDPSNDHKGLESGSKLVQEVWDEFADDPDRLSSTANTIKQHFKADQKSGPAQDTELMGFIAEAPEGKILTKSHIVRERNRKLAQKKKEKVRRESGRLVCEACGFEFTEKYGEERGEGFIECHHTKPLRDLKPGSVTRLNDLVLLCSNCHSMIHAKQPWLEMKELKRLIKRVARGRRPRRATTKRRKG